ncbi:MAG: hypothetical protein LBV12_08790 [Puniceicoccales bacterium]|jgi:hypothetical protein|nr:hypothetical protein [Puniceicoccales bacterium]
MNREQLGQILEMARRRDELRYAWLRNLLLAASGALTLLVSLKSGHTEDMVAQWSMRLAWVSLGLGILFLAVALHGEVWIESDLVKQTSEEIRRRPFDPAPVLSKKPAYYAIAERGAYLCLAVAVIAMVWHGVFS